MKNPIASLTALKALSRRCAIRSTLASAVFAAVSLGVQPQADAGTRKSGFYEYSGTMSTTVLGYGGPRTINLPAIVRMYDSGRLTIFNTSGPYVAGGLFVDTSYDSWGGWVSEPASAGAQWAYSRTYRGTSSYSTYLKLMRYNYGLASWWVLFTNQVFTNKTATDGAFSEVASSYSPSTVKPYNLNVGTKFTIWASNEGKLFMYSTEGGIGGAALTVAFMEN